MTKYLSTFAVVAALSALVLTGCSVPAAPTPDVKASSASQPETTETQETVSDVNPLIKPFGEVVTYDDGVSISVSPGTPFTVTEWGIGSVEGQTDLVFKIVITNNSTEPISPTTIATATSGGQQASSIADVGHPDFGDIGMFPTTTLLPGQTIEWYTAFSVADVNDITLELSPTALLYNNAIFTTVVG